MTSTIKVNNIQNQCGANIINENSNTITIGASGDTISLASGASQTGFGRTGSVNWQTTKKTANFTASSGEGYFCDTAAVGSFTLTLPSSPSAGDIVGLKDYNSNFATANLIIGRNGSNLDGAAGNKTLDTNSISLTLVYVDATQGWVPIEEGTGFIGENFIQATGGTVTTVCTNFKVHTFTGPGTFCVSQISTTSANNNVSYAVVGGGGGGGKDNYPAPRGGGGGGAGGFRELRGPVSGCYSVSPLNGAPAISVTATSFPITVGAGGGGSSGCSVPDSAGCKGSSSTFSTVTSAGGGGGSGHGSPGGGGNHSPAPQTQGASGGGYQYNQGPCSPFNAGLGNQPPVSPAQGQNAGAAGGAPGYSYGGGGGAGGVGGDASPTLVGGAGGVGVSTSITGSAVSYAGGGGSTGPTTNGAGSPCGTGGGAALPVACGSGTTNRGGAGGGNRGGNGNAGGSGVVIIRYKFQ
jgi:hypothetical protein